MKSGEHIWHFISREPSSARGALVTGPLPGCYRAARWAQIREEEWRKRRDNRGGGDFIPLPSLGSRGGGTFPSVKALIGRNSGVR